MQTVYGGVQVGSSADDDQGDLSAAQVARDRDINANLLSKWKRQIEARQQTQTIGRKK